MAKLGPLILLIFSTFYLNYAQATKCYFNPEDRGTCEFYEIRTNESSLYFNPQRNVNVTAVVFLSSVMPTFTHEVCEAFPYLKYLNAVKNITPNALKKCVNLIYVQFWYNQIETLDTNLFGGNPKLFQILFQFNLLKTIDGRMFEPVKELEVLSLSGNYLSDLRLNEFPKMVKLLELSLVLNDLRDLDVEELLQKFPNLSNIRLSNNLFDCSR